MNKSKHFVTCYIDRILYIGWNSPGSANTLNPEVVHDLLEILTYVNTNAECEGSVLFSLEKDTGLGADISLIYGMEDSSAARQVLQELHEEFCEIERLVREKPCVMVIDGKALGGVYELALLFPWIVATDRADTSVAMPEVKIGLIPGLGFLKRAQKRIGLINTIMLATTGKNVFARSAEKMGLVDEVVANIRTDSRTVETVVWENVVQVAARRALELAQGKKMPTRKIGMLEKVWRSAQAWPIVRPRLLSQARKKVWRVTAGHYPAPLAAIDVVEKGWSSSVRRACIVFELPVFSVLAVSPLAKRLMRVFFAREAAKKLKLPGGVAFAPECDEMAVVGGGFMGGQIALLLAKRGFTVSLVDISRDVLAHTMTDVARKVLGDKSLRPHQKAAVIGRIRPTDSYASLGGVQCFIDATTEVLAVKKQVLKSCQECAPEAFVFFNTSTIPIGVIAEDALHPEKVALLHFFSPVGKMDPIEIGGGPNTSPEAIATAYELTKTLGKIPFVVRDNWGFAVNRILMAGMMRAVDFLESGCSIREVDAALKKYGFALDSGHPMGPFELADFVGIKTAAHVSEFLRNLPSFERTFNLLDEMAQRNLTFWIRKGKKRVENPELYDFLKKERRWRYHPDPSHVVENEVVSAMKVEAAMCLKEKVIESKEALNLLMFLATGIPPAFRGGLLDDEHQGEAAEKTVLVVRDYSGQTGVAT